MQCVCTLKQLLGEFLLYQISRIMTKTCVNQLGKVKISIAPHIYFVFSPNIYHDGVTENAGCENDGPSKSRGMKMPDQVGHESDRQLKSQGVTMQDFKMLDMKIDGKIDETIAY